MADSSLPHHLPPATNLDRREARDMCDRIQTAIGAGMVRETPRVDACLDNFRVAGTAPTSQAQRDRSRLSAQASTQVDQRAPQREARMARPARAIA